MSSQLTIQQVTTLLKQVIDPELMVNIVDLGLVYDVIIKEEKKAIQIVMTLTSSGCPLGDMIIQDITQVLGEQFKEYSTDVHLVWEPAWDPDMMTEEGKAALDGF